MWFLKEWHWLITLSVLVSILGILYTGYAFLDKMYRFLSVASQSLTFGIVGMLILSPGLGLVGFLLALIFGLFHLFVGQNVENLSSLMFLMLSRKLCKEERLKEGF